MDPDFEENGFQPPLPIKDIPSGGGKGGSWILTPSTLSLILAALTASGFGVVAKYFPGFGSEGVGKYTQYAALGGSAALAIGGLAGSVFSKSTPQTESPQTGGGIRASGIVTRKTLADVARQMSGSGVSKRSLPTDTTEGVTFLGILGMVVVGGITLSYLRSL
jgi:hypothetical protein